MCHAGPLTARQFSLPAVSVQVISCLVGAGAIVAAMAWRLPIGVPGHRGLIWMTALCVVALTTRSGAGVLTGTAGAAVGLGLGLLANGPLGLLPYILAGASLDLATSRGGLHRRRWLIIPVAGLAHLSALIVPVQKALSVGVAASALGHGLWPVVLSHLVFGLAAGTIAYAGVCLAERRRQRCDG